MSELIASEFLKYRKVIASLLSKIRPNASPQDIEDILQDTFINTYQSSQQQEIRFPKAFMVKTAIRLANRTLEKASRSEITDSIDDYLVYFESPEQVSVTEEKAIFHEEFGFLCSALEQLPDQCRRVFVLKKVYGLSQREISQQLNIAESTVEKHVAKGLLQTSRYYLAAKERGGLLSENSNVISFGDKKTNKGSR